MPRSFKVPAVSFAVSLNDPRTVGRAIVGTLLLLNLIAAAFVFHLFGPSSADLSRQLSDAQTQLLQLQTRLNRTKGLTSKVEKARTEGDQFIGNYMTTRRSTYSTILSELQQAGSSAGLKSKEGAIAPLDPVEGSDTLNMMTVTANFEGTYASLLKFVNLLDRSPRFLIIENLQATPQGSTGNLSISIKLNTFVRDESRGLS